MRSTGKLHLGNYVGALANWVKLQETHDCFFFIADWHALTTDYADTSGIKQNTYEVALDWLAAGLDPEKCVMFVQSHVLQHAEMHMLFSMITPLGWLERVPTYKEQQQNLATKDLSTYGFLGYPVLQAADILIYKADLVPVGEDQVAHIELTREIARRFNGFYAKKTPLLPEPQPLLTKTPKLPGTDGRKMSKSYNNHIEIADDAVTTAKKVRSMITDPLKIRRGDPGRPEICPVFALHKLANRARVAAIETDCRSGALGCVACKGELAETLNAYLQPVRDRRAAIDPAIVDVILEEGSERARAVAAQTLADVKGAMKL